MAKGANSGIKNLRPAKKGEVRNPKGRGKKLINVIKELPPDMREEIYGILGYALTLPSIDDATKFMEMKGEELGRYGFVLQIAIRQLTNKTYGWGAANDILDRLFGKPRLSAEIKHSGGVALHISTDDDTKQLIEEGL